MKTKPILIISAIVIVLVAGIVFFVRSKKVGYVAEKSEITQFLNGFNNRVKEGNADSLLAYFDSGKRLKALKKLVNLLAGKSSLDGSDKPLFDLSFDIDNADVKYVSNNLVEASLPASFKHDSLSVWKTTLSLKIKKVSAHQYKIVRVDARRFLADYASYENLVRSKTGTDKDIYATITLEAFKTAAQLKTRYDSVIWFAHLDSKTWFYVVKGKWDQQKDMNQDYYLAKDSVIDPYKMGLVNPELKEIIPAEYDLIHTLNATFKGMVEVEKGGKKGFYNLDGKLLVPVSYDQVFPIEDDANMAVLRNGTDYFYLKKDTTVSEKANIKIADFFAKIKDLRNAYDLNKNALEVITEYNSKENPNAVYIPPSHLVDMSIVGNVIDFKNPLRKADFEDAHEKYEVAGKETTDQNWFQAAFYSIRDYFLGGRAEFYDNKKLLIVDKKTDRILTAEIGTDYTPAGDGSLDGPCNINSIKQLNDTLFEVKSGANLDIDLYDSTKAITGGPYYHYLVVRGDKLLELPNNRNFGFTKYVKMDDSYLQGCYNMLVGLGAYDQRKPLVLDHLTPEVLRYIKNEIFADYRYQFKDKRWQDVFSEMDSYNDRSGSDTPRPNNVNVNDSLTTIDKYNIDWINKKLSMLKAKPNSLATR